MQSRAELFKALVKQLHIGDTLKGEQTYSYQPKDSHTEEVEATISSLSDKYIEVQVPVQEVDGYSRELKIRYHNLFYLDNNFHIIVHDYLGDRLYLFVVPNQYL